MKVLLILIVGPRNRKRKTVICHLFAWIFHTFLRAQNVTQIQGLLLNRRLHQWYTSLWADSQSQSTVQGTVRQPAGDWGLSACSCQQLCHLGRTLQGTTCCLVQCDQGRLSRWPTDDRHVIMKSSCNTRKLSVWDCSYAYLSGGYNVISYGTASIVTYMRVYVYVYIYNVYILVCTYVYTRHLYLHTYRHTYIHTYVHACMHTCILTYIHSFKTAWLGTKPCTAKEGFSQEDLVFLRFYHAGARHHHPSSAQLGRWHHRRGAKLEALEHHASKWSKWWWWWLLLLLLVLVFWW